MGSAANQKMWQSLGFAAQFAIGATFPSLDTSETVLQHFELKLIILSALLVVGYLLAFFVICKYPVDLETSSDPKGERLVDGGSEGRRSSYLDTLEEVERRSSASLQGGTSFKGIPSRGA